MRRIICSEQGNFSQEYWRISRKFNAVQGKSDKQKLKVIDEQFLSITKCVLKVEIGKLKVEIQLIIKHYLRIVWIYGLDTEMKKARFFQNVLFHIKF